MTTDTQPQTDDVTTDVDHELRLTSEVLRALDSCGTYTDRFERLFPIEEYPDGVVPTRELCVEHVAQFDWNWAAGTMLADVDPYSEVLRTGEVARTLVAERDTLYAEQRRRLDEWRQTHSESSDYPSYGASADAVRENEEIHREYGDALRALDRRTTELCAVTFAELFADVSRHSDRLVQARRRADEHAENVDRRRLDRAVNAVRETERAITLHRDQLATSQREIERLEQRLPEVREAVEKTRATVETRRVVRAARQRNYQVREAEQRITTLREQLAEAEAAAAALTATDDASFDA